MAKTEWQYLYNSKRWLVLRDQVLQEEPLCKYHYVMGDVEPATIVDHIRPHKGNIDLFFDRKNLQPLCKFCHDSHKQALEKSGLLAGSDKDGNPVDPNHHWNAGYEK